MANTLTDIDALDQAATLDSAGFDDVLACLTGSLKLQEAQETTGGREAWQRHIWVVVQKIIPKWAFSLASHREELERTLLFSPARSLPVLLESLQSDIPINVLEIYAQHLKRLISARYFESYAVDRAFFCSALCSIPARLANAFGLRHNEEEWFLDRNFYEMLARQIVKHVTTLCNRIEEIDSSSRKSEMEKQTLFVSELMTKMFRQSQEAALIRVVYPAVAHQCRNNDLTAETWATIWERVERVATMEKLAKSLLFYLRNTHYPITSSAFDTARFLFYSPTTMDPKQTDRVKEFLSIALFDVAKVRWADTRATRIAIAIALYAAGLEALKENTASAVNVWCLSDPASDILMESLRRMIDTWTDPVFIRHAGYQECHYTTKALLLLVGYASKAMIQNIVMETPLMSGIARWFETSDPALAKLGVVVGESLSSLIDDDASKLDCGVLNPQTDSELIQMKELVNVADAFKKVEDHTVLTAEEPIIGDSDSDSSGDEEEAELNPDALVVPEEDTDTDSAESAESDLEPYPMDDESEEEEQSISQPKKQRPKRPVYILDLIAYLKDHEDPVKLDIGLSAAEQVIRQKTGVGSEIRDHAIVLAKRLLGLPEEYDLTDLRGRQQGALTALIVACPQLVAQFIIDQLYDRNMSVSQKQMLLSSITMAVRELAGWSEKVEDDQAAVNANDMSKMLEGVTLDEKSLKVGKSRVFSRRLEVKEKQSRAISRNLLSGLAGPVFFFPLLVGWWEGAQGRTKMWIGRDPLLTERFAMTLNVIMHCATNTPDKRRIVMEYFEFALSMRYVNCSHGMRRALLLGIDVILNTCYKGQETLLMDDYATELAKTKLWLEDIMETSQEDELKQLSLMLLARLMNISTTTPAIQY